MLSHIKTPSKPKSCNEEYSYRKIRIIAIAKVRIITIKDAAKPIGLLNSLKAMF